MIHLQDKVPHHREHMLMTMVAALLNHPQSSPR